MFLILSILSFQKLACAVIRLQELRVDGFQLRDNRMPDAVAGDLFVAVGVVFHVCNMVVLSVLPDSLCGERQHRADGFAVHGRDAAEPFQTGAATEVEQLGFGGVVGVVGGDEKVEIV